MKTKTFFGKVAVTITYLIVILSSISYTFAQCPTITNSSPVICDASGLTFNDLNVYATSTNGIIWYDQVSNGSPFNGSQLVSEGTYYADDNTGSCGVRSSISVSFQVPPTGQNLDAIFCDNENATIQTYIDQELQFHIPIGGSVAVFNDVNLTSQANSTDVIPLGATNYFIVFIDSSGCESQIEPGSTAVFLAPADPAPSDPQEFCSDTNPTIGNLDPGTTGSFSWYQNINGSGDPILPALPPGTPLINGNTYYVQVNDLFCNSNTVPVIVSINDPVDPGISNTLEYCEDSIPTSDFNLYDILGGSPDTTGSWSGPLPTTGGHLGTVNISTLTAPGDYVFTYTVPSTGVCPDGVSTVTITIYPVLSSGVPSAANPATFCVADLPAAYDLFLLLDNEDPNGQWSQNGTNISSPADLTGLTPGNYDFIYTQNLAPNPCPEESTTVQVVVLQDPEAGNAINQVFCENDLVANSPFDLFNALDGTQDNNNGVWTDVANTVVSNPIDISIFTVAGSPYSFTYTIDNGTCMDSETITITVEPAPESGTPVATFPEFCEGEAPSNFDLFDLLDNEDQTGTWYLGTDNTGSIITNPVDLSGYSAGTYNFTFDVDAIGSCDDVLVTVQVTINPLPNTGVPTPAIFCENDLAANSPLDLLVQLSGQDAGGTWTDDNATGALSGTNVDLTILTIGSYNFSYTITDANGCTNSSTVVITVEEAPESGNALMPIEFCENEVAANSPFDLFTLLDGTQDNNGTWYVGSDTSGSVATNPVDISGFTIGTYDYTYSVPIIGSCSDVDVTVQIIINPIPNTGVPTPAIFCENDLAANSLLDLLGQLSGQDAGGTWTDDDATGALSGTDVDLTLLTIGTYNFTYSITANGCTNSSTVVITVEEAPESGNALMPVEFCENEVAVNSPFDLFTLLDGTQDNNGTWYVGSDTSGSVASNPVDISGLTTGTYDYTYSVPIIGSCSDVDVTVQIIVNPIPNTGVPTPATFCENDLAANSPLDLLGQLSGQDAGGTWTDDDATGALSGTDVDLTLLTIGSYNFTYTITANGCTNSSTVVITVEDAPESGTVNAPAEFCLVDITTGQTFNLFDVLTDEDQTGTWTDDDATGALTANTVALDALSTGTFNFTFDVDAIGTCDDVLVTVSIIINDTPAPTVNANQSFCDNATVADLTATGNSIQWYDDATGGVALADTTVLVDGENYFASQIDPVTGCVSSTRSEVIVTINATPNPGSPATTPISVCNDNNAVDLNTGLDGTQDTGGVWQDDDATGALSGNILDATGLTAGTYNFTYLVTATAPCVDQSTTITITVSEPLNAGIDAILDVCDDSGTTDLFTLLGTADTGGTWSPTLTSGTGIFDPLLDAEGTYTYSLINACGIDSADVIVTITQAPNAGLDGSFDICVVDIDTTNSTLDLLTVLQGTPNATGTFVNNDGAAGFSGTQLDLTAVAVGTYTFAYTVTAMSPCTTNATSVATVTVNDSPSVTIIEANPEFCSSENPTIADLNASVSGTNIVWYEDANSTTPLDATDALPLGTEDYFATQSTGSGCESSVRIQVNATVNDVPTPTLIDPNQELCINDAPTINDLTLNISEYDSTLNNVIWYDAATGGSAYNSTALLTVGSTYFAVLVDVSTGCESSVRLQVTPDLTGCGLLVIPDGFSPNGDGTNDTFDIDNVNILFPNFEIEIFNRYGNIVYKGNASSPRFDGRSNQSGTINQEELPVGVYFYVFNFNDGINKPKQGRLYLSR
ncbi:gliding motility-associated C-terminal domain-containing protein [Olleya sp. YS]|uniref:gliding motility-associated C-terminal domain-containing protein n=1 Tax=Olleya sp. YS TaxID=3028318 RepID=UPI0024341BB0|nr:gliding motility-associated C-terminal domain-containing protein [Olleya sp. YS]WGD35450.1 gliding motility-associated C-terminal domain-containing protein [Olleya sp. YS]